jgi:tellurite resistance protein
MATKADFTEDEWKALQRGLTGTGMLVSVSDRDFTDTFGEASALAKYLAEERDRNQSELMRELVHTHGSGFGLTASTEKVEHETTEAIRAGLAALEAKSPGDAGAYRELVLGVAERVAEAKGGLKPDETAAIEKIKQALA